MKKNLLIAGVFSTMMCVLIAQADVQNITQGGATYPTIQGAADAANSGDTLLVSIGHYTEHVTIAGKSLTLKGGYLPGFASRTNDIDLTCIDADGSGIALLATNNATIALEYLMLTNGLALYGAGILISENVTLTADYCKIAHNLGLGGAGAAIGYNSTLVLNDSIVAGNRATFGGGIYAVSNATIELTGTSSIEHNYAEDQGGGVFLQGGTLTAQGWYINIKQNIAGNGGGGVAVAGGNMTLNPAHVNFNEATNTTARGGGILVYDGGHVTIGDSGNIAGNTAYDGGGIYAEDANVQLYALIHGNSAENFGGGLCIVSNSHLIGPYTYIGYPMVSGENTANYGAGIYVDHSTIDFSGDIYNNYADSYGGGIYANASTVLVHNAHIGGTEDNQPNGISGNYAPGMYIENSSYVVLSNTVIASNIFLNAAVSTYGGGMYVEMSEVELIDSTIAHHIAPSLSGARGAGAYIRFSTFTMNNSRIISNTAYATGGGVRLYNNGRFSVKNGSKISYNNAYEEGGGIACGGAFKIEIEDTTFFGNSAGTDGGAVYLSAGTQTFAGAWTLQRNKAEENGGAIAVAGTAKCSFDAEDYCLVYFNRAMNGHGGMVYLHNESTVQLKATSGNQIYIYANNAGGNGGALYADNSGYFDLYGRVDLHLNYADNGGAIYLSNGSTIWIDDYIDDCPQLWGNYSNTGSGGAIFAIDSPSVRLYGAILGKDYIGNDAYYNGGAIASYNSTMTVKRATAFSYNTARIGGAIALSNTLLTLQAENYEAASFVQNISVGSSTVDGGGAIYAEDGTHISAQNTVFTDNTSTNNGGALWLRNATAEITALFPEWQGGSTPPVLFSNNYAALGRGGALYLNENSSATLSDAMLIHNNGSYGGGIRTENSSLDILNAVLCNNSTGIRTVNSDIFTRYCTIIDNNAMGIIGSGNISASNCIIRGHTDNVEPGHNVNYSNIEGGYATGTGNIDADPLFVDKSVCNFALTFSSPCVDAGADLGVDWDCIGATRPMNSGYDMGAYEMDPAPIQVVLPALIDFGDVVVGESAHQNILVANIGNGELNGSVLYVPVPTFTVTPDSYITPGLNSTNLLVTFNPTVEFTWSQTVVFASNGGTQDVVLVGNGIPEPACVFFGIIVLLLCAGKLRRN